MWVGKGILLPSTDRRRFEKSLYDLIRGLRNHRGSEDEYIRNSLRECRTEIKGPDMDIKATALLKLIYLEMFGHDMSWASFHVLEVMSSTKYAHKRVGYLAAAQSFRPDTEVLMLATNLLKKDVASSLPPTISLPMITVPHVITSSLAHSLLSDIFPRLSHSSPNVRKKSVATLYRLALVYPDSLKLAWPKMKDILMDDDQDSSVTAAIVNVVCELGWRRPSDFLPLAPRLFEFLVETGNNWMAIKIIKLFASLTPLEPRLIKKLLGPLTHLIQTESAMSLLYECINGVIQGGILEGAEGVPEGDEVASLCVTKLRGMIIIDGDPNLKYVSLLAFNRIIESHPHLVHTQEDVIAICIDDPDISIRLKALDLVTAMVDSENLVVVVDRLMGQLEQQASSTGGLGTIPSVAFYVEPAEDHDTENPEAILRLSNELEQGQQTLPPKYRLTMIHHILNMCSKDAYNNITDFDWYIEVLLRLFHFAPGSASTLDDLPLESQDHSRTSPELDIFSAIGWQLRNVSVRVEAVRPQAVGAAKSLLEAHISNGTVSDSRGNADNILNFAAWIAGEYVADTDDAQGMLNTLLRADIECLPARTLCYYLQAIPKVYTHIVSAMDSAWSAERRAMVSLQNMRILGLLEPLVCHPDLEVQERAVEFIELLRIGHQAVTSDQQDKVHGPLLLTQALPQLFSNFNLNPVAPSAQRKVPVPTELDLDNPINSRLSELLKGADKLGSGTAASAEFESFYHHRFVHRTSAADPQDNPPAILNASYQQIIQPAIDTELMAQQRLARRQRNMDDPFHIGGNDASSAMHSPTHETLQRSNDDNLNVDSIPIMSLDVANQPSPLSLSDCDIKKHRKRKPKKVQVVQDITIDAESGEQQDGKGNTSAVRDPTRDRIKKSLLSVDSSELSKLSLPNGASTTPAAGSQDLEMATALAEVERLRLEMQRASERVEAADGAPAEGTLVKKKKRKEPRAASIPARSETPGEETIPQLKKKGKKK